MSLRVHVHPHLRTWHAARITQWWAVGRGARVINLSFGTPPGSSCANYPYIQNAINHAIQQKVVVVAAAGNSNGNTATVVPASCTGVIAVAASTSAGLRAPWSNKGTRVDITAPGHGR